MFYQLYEMQHAAMLPFRMAAKAQTAFWLNEANPLASTSFGKQAKAGLAMFERMTRRYPKPHFNITQCEFKGETVDVIEEVVWQKPFCNLIHFRKAVTGKKPQKKILMVAPMSGHYATLLRSTVEAMLPQFDVYVTDWLDAKNVPASVGPFDLDDYTDYLFDIFKHLGERAHVMAVCQPSVPVLAAVSLMAARNDALRPLTMTLMGGPIDTRCSPTAVNTLAQSKGETWFRNNVLMDVPPNHAGFGRKVYPGFLQLAGFISMNADRHLDQHRKLYWHLVEGDEHNANKIEEFYDEYMSVMDLASEFYLQTVERVFINQRLPHGTYHYRGDLVQPSLITDTALLTIEGERDDISGVGQTRGAHDLCTGLAEKDKAHHLQMGVGHYGVFSGSRFARDIAPLIRKFMDAHQG
jgi:poly(3-hydroxybutyrate) depolymerase